MIKIEATVRQTLIAVVNHVRGNKAKMSIASLENRDGITPSKLDVALPFISLMDRTENPDRVQCVQHGNNSIGPVNVYVCKSLCPLLHRGKCRAGQEVFFKKPVDKREVGAPPFSDNGKTPRRSARS